MLDACRSLKVKRSPSLGCRAGFTSNFYLKSNGSESLGRAQLARHVLQVLLNLYCGWLNPAFFSLFLSGDDNFTRKQLVIIKGGAR